MTTSEEITQHARQALDCLQVAMLDSTNRGERALTEAAEHIRQMESLAVTGRHVLLKDIDPNQYARQEGLTLAEYWRLAARQYDLFDFAEAFTRWLSTTMVNAGCDIWIDPKEVRE